MRQWLILVLAVSLTISSTATAADEVAPGVTLLPGSFVPGTQPDGNSVVFTGPDGLVVVDTGRHAAHTQKILAFAQAAGKPIVAVVNTHWHLDHVGGNPRIRNAYPGVRVHASTALEDALTGFLADYRTYLVGAIAKAADEDAKAPLRAELAILDAGKSLMPDEPVTQSEERTLGGRRLVLHLEHRAVTAGDVWVFDPETRVLVAGDLVTLPAPFLDTACPAGWQDALGRLAAVDFAVLVPGHGPPMDHQAFDRYRTAFDGLLACSASDAENETCIQGWLDGVGNLVPEADHGFARSLVGYYLDQHLRGDPARTAALCGNG